MKRLAGVLLALVTTAACGARNQAAGPGARGILRVDPQLEILVPSDARIEKLADGFVFTEGPVWIQDEARLIFAMCGPTASIRGPRARACIESD